MGLTHQTCNDCGSSDALQINDDGSTKCHSCQKFIPAVADGNYKQSTKCDFNPITGVVKAIPSRGLSKDTCQKYGYRVKDNYKGDEIHIATYRDSEGSPIFQKIRTIKEKEFTTNGKFKPLLYGMHLWNGYTKKLIITEGEIDCLSVYQCVGNYPVVSIPNGAGNAKKAIKENLDWIEKFEEVVFMFDMDEQGRKAAKECAELISIGKAKVAELPLKDPNEMLQAGRIKELIDATWRAVEFRPDGIVSGEVLWEEVKKEVEWGFDYPFPTLTKLTYGIRLPELIVFGAGTGMGKTEFFKEIETHLLTVYEANIGIIHLEETTKDTVLGIMGKYASQKFHVPECEATEEQKREAFDKTIGTDKVHIYDSFGTTDLDTIKATIQYMVKGKDCKFVFLDHITALGDCVENAGEVNQKMRNIVSELALLTRKLNFTLFTISHLRKSDSKKTHEEGGRVHLDDLYGAAALKQWASFVFGLERNQQATNESERHTTTLRCLKDRYTGQAAGCTVRIKYDKNTGRLLESEDAEIIEGFGEGEDATF